VSVPNVFLRRARIRGLKEGQVQRGRSEATENDVKDDAERFQDYGFSGNPVDGQGLVLTVDGHTIVVRMDRLAERPQLAAYEVAVWHKEGHKITLKDGKVIQVDCDTYRVNAAVKVEFNTPLVTNSGDVTAEGGVNAVGRVTGQAGVTGAGIDLEDHGHDEVEQGTDVSGGPVAI
jgi:phage baseplate assembly protein V